MDELNAKFAEINRLLDRLPTTWEFAGYSFGVRGDGIAVCGALGHFLARLTHPAG